MTQEAMKPYIIKSQDSLIADYACNKQTHISDSNELHKYKLFNISLFFKV